MHMRNLFQGSNDDVVKLYDLTMLCDQKESAGKYKDRHNPFTIPVASLLYKMSINLMQQVGNVNVMIAACKMISFDRWWLCDISS